MIARAATRVVAVVAAVMVLFSLSLSAEAQPQQDLDGDGVDAYSYDGVARQASFKPGAILRAAAPHIRPVHQRLVPHGRPGVQSAADDEPLARLGQSGRGLCVRMTSYRPNEHDLASISRSGVAANGADDLARLSTVEQRSLRSLQRQFDAHQTKLDLYRANPEAYDNLGILERAPTPEIRQSIIDGRIRHLETEIRTFQDQIDKLLGGG